MKNMILYVFMEKYKEAVGYYQNLWRGWKTKSDSGIDVEEHNYVRNNAKIKLGVRCNEETWDSYKGHKLIM